MTNFTVRVHPPAPYRLMGLYRINPGWTGGTWTGGGTRFSGAMWDRCKGMFKKQPSQLESLEVHQERKRLYTRSMAMMILGMLFFVPDYHKLYTAMRHLLADDVQMFPLDKIPKVATVPVDLELQGNNNGCGSTSLAMGVNSVDPGKKLNRQKVDQEIRRLDIWTTPDNIILAAKKLGIQAELYNDSAFEEIQQHICMGNPVIALVNLAGKKDFSAHYEVISGFVVHPDGKKELRIHCPARGRFVTDFEHFKETWEDVQVAGVPTGYNRMIIVLSKKKLPPSRKPYTVPGTVASRSADVINTATSLSQGDLETLVAKDIPNGKLLLFALFVVGVCNLISPRMYRDWVDGMKKLPQEIKTMPDKMKRVSLHLARGMKHQSKVFLQMVSEKPLATYLLYLVGLLFSKRSQPDSSPFEDNNTPHTC